MTAPSAAAFAALSIGATILYTVDEITQETTGTQQSTAAWLKLNYQGYMDVLERSSWHQSMTKSLTGAVASKVLVEEFRQVVLTKDIVELADIIRTAKGYEQHQRDSVPEARLAHKEWEMKFDAWMRSDSVTDPAVA